MEGMAAPRLDVVGVIVSDMEASIAFYRRLGVKFPEPHDPEGHGHVEATLDGGIRFALDTEETIRSFDPGWAPTAGGHRVVVAFLFESPNAVDERVFTSMITSTGPSEATMSISPAAHRQLRSRIVSPVSVR